MSVTGIIAEFNPLHNGHKYLLSQAAGDGCTVCVISGNWVQRGETAVAEKRIRARAALLCGADLVLELPVLWSMSTAQNFALGGISALRAVGCDRIMFGSECGDTSALIRASEILQSSEFSRKLSAPLQSGVTFAAARQTAAAELGLDPEILRGANNNLAVEYISAAKRLGYQPEFTAVKRRGAAHDSTEEAEFVSASLLRERLRCGDYSLCRRHMPQEVLELFSPESISDISRLNTAILTVLRTKTLEELKALPDLSEGVENKLFSAIRLATSTQELYNMLKVKRYTLARIRRLVLSAFIGAESSLFMKPLPYVRVLGFNKRGEQLLKSRASGCDIPVVTRVREIEQLGSNAKAVLETEAKATDLFALSLNKPLPCGLEYTSKLIKTEC